MSIPHFLINDLLENYKNDNKNDYNNNENIQKLKKTLFEKGVLTKEFVDDELMLLYHKYNSPITTELERECRSLIIDMKTLKIKSYSCESPRLNKEGMDFILLNSFEKQIITTCYEGTYLSLFNHNNKWYISTRRCLDSNKSIFINDITQLSLTEKDQSHYNMFEEILKKANYENFDNFCSKLDKNKSYYFVLIHHQNKHTIDYTAHFGKNYGRACLTSIRDSNMCELDIYNSSLQLTEQAFPYGETQQDGSVNILFIPTKHDSIQSFDSFCNFNKSFKYDFTAIPESEGIIIRIWSSKLNKYNLIKLQNASYQFAQVVGTEQNIFKGILYLYQLDKLVDYFASNSSNSNNSSNSGNLNIHNFNKMINPLNTNESYDTVGIVDAVFKVCTSELFELFKILWSLKNGQHQNKDLYNLLPKEYKDIMFGIRGIYYKKKSVNHKKDSKDVTLNDIKSSYLKINDVYNYLKNLPIEQLIAFIRMRKLMFNWVKQCPTNNALKDFNLIWNYCDKVQLKLCAIFTNKLYPNIMPNDIPPQKNLIETI